MKQLAVKTTVIDWQAGKLEITDTSDSKHTISLGKAIQVTMIGHPNRKIKSMYARNLGTYMERGYVIEHIFFEVEA